MFARGSVLLVALFILGLLLPGVGPQPPAVAGTSGIATDAPDSIGLPAPKTTPRPRRDRRGRPGEERFKAAGESARCTGPGLMLLPKSGRCTHGGDAIRPRPVSVAPQRSGFSAQAIDCEGDGRTGFRVQVLYVYAPEAPTDTTRFNENIQGWLDYLNGVFRQNAIDTGGIDRVRDVRFVTDGSCRPQVVPVQVSTAALVDFDQMIVELVRKGYNRKDRIYLSYVEVHSSEVGYCGIGSISPDSRANGRLNWNNVGPAYSAVARNCWGGRTPVHELMHNLGGVQKNSPNSTRTGYHCLDDYDIMCYDDNGDDIDDLIYPHPCPDENGEDFLLDCNHNDYYHANPAPGSYLAQSWNTVNNRFLRRGAPDNAPPSAGIVRPTPKQLVPGKRIKVRAVATDATGISSVAIRVCRGSTCSWERGKPIGTDATAPYQATWKVPPRGTYTFVARAVDSVGNVTISAPKRVRVKPARKNVKGKNAAATAKTKPAKPRARAAE